MLMLFLTVALVHLIALMSRGRTSFSCRKPLPAARAARR